MFAPPYLINNSSIPTLCAKYQLLIHNTLLCSMLDFTGQHIRLPWRKAKTVEESEEVRIYTRFNVIIYEHYLTIQYDRV